MGRGIGHSTAVGRTPQVEGEILLDGKDIYGKDVNVTELRRRVGMVFQKPNPFPKSIYENVAYGLRIQGVNNKRPLDEGVEWALKGAALWDEVKDRLNESGTALSGGQQQLVAVARAVIAEPQVILADEPTGSLHSSQGRMIMDLLAQLNREGTTIIQVTHNEDYAAFGERIIQLKDGWIVDE